MHASLYRLSAYEPIQYILLHKYIIDKRILLPILLAKQDVLGSYGSL